MSANIELDRHAAADAIREARLRDPLRTRVIPNFTLGNARVAIDTRGLKGPVGATTLDFGITELRAELGRRLATVEVVELCEEQGIGPAARLGCGRSGSRPRPRRVDDRLPLQRRSVRSERVQPLSPGTGRGGGERRHLQSGAGRTFPPTGLRGKQSVA
ncbi:hypothetical protein ACWD0A_27560 [Streptomyces sp. NPDC002867]